MYCAYTATLRKYICGEIVLAIILHLLAGDSCFYLAVLYDTELRHFQNICYCVLLQRIIKPNIGDINMIKYVYGTHVIANVSVGLGINGARDG